MLNKFSCGLFISDIKSGQIEYSNRYLSDALNYNEDVITGQCVTQLFSKASLIFLESYLYPMLLKEGELFEMQLTILNKQHESIPIVTNVNLQGNQIYWSVFISINRDKMYQELIEARDQLEKQTEILSHQATTDPLTSLLNRRAGIQGIERLMNHACRNSSSLSFVMIDIDYFKRINDQLGHLKADEILVEVAKCLQAVSRKTDVVARWGGEEFLIVLYDTPFDKVQVFCHRLHKELNQITVFEKSVTASVGVAVCDLDKDKVIDFESVLNEADKLMFKAKNKGRNRTEYSIFIK